MLLPIILMLILGYLGTKERLLKDEKMKNEFDDMKKVLGNLPQGVALTVDFPTMSRQTYQEKGVSSRIKAVNELIKKAEDTDDLEIALSPMKGRKPISPNASISMSYEDGKKPPGVINRLPKEDRFKFDMSQILMANREII